MNDESWNMVVDAGKLTLANSEADAAYQQYNYAGSLLERRKIEQRRAELFSTAFQYVAKGELFGQFQELSAREREIMRAVARYVVTGRASI